MKASELIRGALEDLRHDGWKKGGSYLGEREACMDTALCRRRNASLASVDPYYDALTVLDGAARALFGERMLTASSPTFVIFNDHKDTTFADVEQVMEKAAIRLEEFGQ